MSQSRIALIVGSTRKGRFADHVIPWLMEIAGKHEDLSVEVVDLRDHPLPFFDEPIPPAMAPSQKPEVQAWQSKVAQFDGYIFVSPEYNNSVTAVLKNAIDHVYNEWVRKPAAFVGYGGVGGARSVQHLRHITIELQMAPIRHGVTIAGGDFMAVMKGQTQLSKIEHLGAAAGAMLDQLAWWTKALTQARVS